MHQKDIKKGLYTVSGFALLAAMPSFAMAQAAAPAAGETVVVTGLRGSLSRSITAKRVSDMVTENISAEEIGKLPDASIAEALARLPGLAGQRVGGEVEVINLRGTSPDFTTTTLNGRQLGSLSDGRGIEINQFPSELINGVTVYKTPNAAVAGQGLSGTIDLKSLRPLSVSGRQISLNFRFDTTTLDQLNPDVEKGGWRGSASYVNQFMDGQLGVALGYAHSVSTNQTQYQEIWGYDGNTGAQATALNSGTVSGHSTRALSNRKTRDGLMAVVEYQPNDNSHTTLDLFYSKLVQDEVMRGVEGPMAWTGNTVTRNTVTPYHGTQISDTGTISNVVTIINNQFHGRDDSIFAGGLNHEMKVGTWDLSFDAAYSKAEGDALNVQILGNYGPARQGETIAFDWNPNGFTGLDPSLNYGDASKIYLGDNSPWGGTWGEGFRQVPHIEDSYSSLDFRAKTELSDSFLGGFFGSFEAGLNFTDHDKAKSSTDDDLCFKQFQFVTSLDGSNQNGAANCGSANGVGGQYRRSLTSIPSIGHADLSFANWGPLAAFDVLGVMNSQMNIVPRRDSNRWNRNWTLNEKVFTAYVRGNIDTEVMGHHVGGNLGIQFVNSETESTGFAITNASNNPTNVNYNNVPSQQTVGTSYSDVLPSLNLSVDLTDNLKLRFGAAKQMARPRPDDLRASVNASLGLITSPATIVVNGNTVPNPDVGKYRWSGNGGNPLLKPYRADAYDVSFEWYVNSGTSVSVAGFYKNVETYIFSQTVLFDFSSSPNPQNFPLVSPLGNFSQPMNGTAAKNNKDAFIRGFEYAVNIDFSKYFPDIPVANGLLFSGNWSHNMTNISPNGPTGSGRDNRLPGFSGYSRNLTVGYEKHGFSVRVSERWRSAVRTDAAGFFANREFARILPDSQVDAQIGYKFTDGPLSGLAVTLQGTNLTDTLYQRESGVALPDGALLPSYNSRYGARYLLGVTYKF